MKKYLKKLLREGLNGNPTNNHKLCNVCRLKAISINENEFKGVLTEEERQHKLSNILLMLEKEIKVGDNLTKKLNSINSELAKKLLVFFNSDKIKDSAEIEYVDYDKNNEKLFTLGYTDRNGNQKTRLLKINKLLNYLGSSIQDIKDYEIEDLIGHLKKADTTQLREVTGDDILKAYHCANYDEGETMGSCMRYESAQEYLKIYTDNPEQVSCLVLINPENDKVRGRALIWTTTDGTRVMDRVYSTNKEYNTFFNNYAEENGISTNRSNHEVVLENGGEYDYYPYMDTFMYYTPDNDTLSTEDGELELQDTSGGHRDSNNVWSEIQQINIPEDEAVYSEHYDDWIRYDDTVNTWDDKWILDSDAIRLDAGEHKNAYALDSEAVQDWEGDWITAEEAYVLDAGEYSGEYALGDDVVELYNYGGNILRKESVELTAGQYEEEWCLREDAYVLLEGDDEFGIISVDDLGDYEDVRYVTFEEFEEKGADAFN